MSMYDLINKHSAEVLASVGKLGIPAYLQLRADLTSGGDDVTTDENFRSRYRRYWRMNVARLPESFYERYCELLGECARNGEVDMRRIVRALADPKIGTGSLQFSFATKLAHIVDPRVEERLIDWLIWGWVAVLRERAREGEAALYE